MLNVDKTVSLEGFLEVPIWTGQYAEMMKQQSEGNMSPGYNVAHTCGVDSRWFPASFPGGGNNAVFLPNQQPQPSETMIIEDGATGAQYKGGKKIDNGYGEWKESTWNNKEALDPNRANLSYKEQQILMYTKLAWDAFMSLEKKGEDDIVEFKDAIHRLQQIIALRVARRVDTAVWLQPTS